MLVSCRCWRWWFWFYTPCLKERTEVVVSDSCFQVSMEMIVIGKYVRSEGRYRKALYKCEGCSVGPQSACSLWMKPVLGWYSGHHFTSSPMVQCKPSVRYRARKSSRSAQCSYLILGKTLPSLEHNA
jgi:hypothetical protein